ncbi:MAG: hypothetical protein ACOY31_12455 [Bacillota bacterium]
MDFNHYRKSLQQIQHLAGNYTALTSKELGELNKLCGECASLKEKMVQAFLFTVDGMEDDLSFLIDRLAQIKDNLSSISGPEGTLEDILLLEPDWKQINSLQSIVRELQGAAGNSENGPHRKAQADESVAGDPAVTGEREVAAATDSPAEVQVSPEEGKPSEKSGKIDNTIRKQTNNKKQSSAICTPQKPGGHHKKEQKPQPGQAAIKPVAIKKVCGEAEERLIEEITKNIKLIKSDKKKI